LLRPVAQQARHQALSRDQSPDYQAYDPPEGWGWCYVDEVLFGLSDRKTPPHFGPIPRYY
jgi:hypothetical protein